MDDIVLRGMAKWPNVPSVFGWLSLDRRGHWLLKGDRVTNPGITEFFGRNYSHDAQGRWFLQNGPQRVCVSLDYTPFIYRISAQTGSALTLTAHTGASTATVNAAFMDDAGQLLLASDIGIGLVHDTDLELLIPRFRDATAKAPDEIALAAAFDALQAGHESGLLLQTGNGDLPLHPLLASDAPARFGFVARPVQPDGEEECY